MKKKMKHIALLVIIFLSILLSSCFGTTHEREAHFFHELRWNINGRIDKREFNASAHFVAAKIDPQEGMREKDMIERLPGQPPVRFNQYGGYVTVDRAAGRALYYYFVEAQQSHNSLPLLLWLNGGPGCSSLGFGAFEELGPFHVLSDGKTLYENQYSWNHVANVLFLESPAGVGFSYSNTTKDIENSGDKITSNDNYVFLLNWLERFPMYKNRDFYICGESYAGHYVPQLAQTILYHNQKAKKGDIVNLKGIMIGNAVINDETDYKGQYEYFASHALISDENLDQILKNCDFSAESVSTECYTSILETERDTTSLDIYNIYASTCTNSTLTSNPNYTYAGLNVAPCIDDYVHSYLNTPEVQKALHANLTHIPYDWESCSKVIKNWTDSPSTIIPILNALLDDGLRVWIYSGDIDGRIPVTSTKLSIKQMKLPPITPWLPWYYAGQVGGYSQVYKGNLTFATVRGSGHQVPMWQPPRALFLITHFLFGMDLRTI